MATKIQQQQKDIQGGVTSSTTSTSVNDHASFKYTNLTRATIWDNSPDITELV